MTKWKKNLMILWIGCFTTSCGSNLVVPFLPLYIQQFGVHNLAQIDRLSGIVFGITFLAAAIMSPFWGRLADFKGRKPVLMATSLGLSIGNLLFVFTSSVPQLIVFRLILGVVSGYIPAANSFIAKNVPENKAGWALATLSTGGTAGALLGPVIGGYLDELIGMRWVFTFTSAFLFMSFLIACFFLHEKGGDEIASPAPSTPVLQPAPVTVVPKVLLATLLISACLINTANQSIEPIVSLYVKQLLQISHTGSGHVSLISGMVVSATGFGVIFTASFMGKLADRTGYMKILRLCVIFSAAVFIPMAFVRNAWQLLVLRLLLGFTQAGILPIISTLHKKTTPPEILGRIFGYNQAAQFAGLVIGPVLGGEISSCFGYSYIFYFTALLLIINLAVLGLARRKQLAKYGIR